MKKITNNLLQQTILMHNNDDNSFNLIFNLKGILQETFKDNNELP